MAWKKKVVNNEESKEIEEIKKELKDKPKESKEDSKLWNIVEIPVESRNVIHNSETGSSFGVMEALAELLNRTE